MKDGWLLWGDELAVTSPMLISSWRASRLGALPKPLAMRYDVGEVKMAMERKEPAERATTGEREEMRGGKRSREEEGYFFAQADEITAGDL